MTARSELQHCEVVSLAVFSVTESVGICYSCSQKSNTHCSIQKRCGVMGKGPFLGWGACGCSFRCRDIGVLSDALFDSLQHIFMSPHMSESEHAPIPPPQVAKAPTEWLAVFHMIWFFFTRRNIIRVIFNTKVWWLPTVKILSQVSEQRELLKDDMLSLFSSPVDPTVMEAQISLDLFRVFSKHWRAETLGSWGSPRATAHKYKWYKYK